jgi:PAS domain S-box-containing protein
MLPAFAWVPSAQALALANTRLRNEVAGHEATLRELQAVGRELEKSVAERTRELSLARASFETALRGSHVIVFTQDRDLTYTSISNSMFGLGVEQILHRSDADVLPADSRAAIIAMKQRVLETGQAVDSEVSVREEDQLLWYDFHIEPLRDTTGDISGIVCAAVDVTGRKENEAHLRLLMRELTHRSKNLLAVIQAMARQTGRDAPSVNVFLDQFGSRLQALATSHDLLIQESWHGASLYDLVKSQLAHHIDAKDPQVTLEGPMILLRPESAQNLGLALHELATNAAKYGALSVATGQVSVTWRKVPAEGGNAVEIVWAETGGPPVEEPSRTGFGVLVIKRNLARALDADVDLTFAREGVQCRVSIPASQIQSIERKT